MLRIVLPVWPGSSRLPAKMLEKLAGKSVMRHALDRTLEAAGDRWPVYAATPDDIRFHAEFSGRCAIIATPPVFACGTDRMAAAADLAGWPDEDVIVNVQCDMPFIDPRHLTSFFEAAERGGKWKDLLTAFCDQKLVHVRADGFAREILPTHIGLYAFRRPALRRFAALPISPGESYWRLEQLRAIDNGFDWALHALPEMPFEINTPDDLAAARRIAGCLGLAA